MVMNSLNASIPNKVTYETCVLDADCPGFVSQHEAPASQKNVAHFQKLLQGYDGLVKDTTSAAWWLTKQSPQVSIFHLLFLLCLFFFPPLSVLLSLISSLFLFHASSLLYFCLCPSIMFSPLPAASFCSCVFSFLVSHVTSSSCAFTHHGSNLLGNHYEGGWMLT